MEEDIIIMNKFGVLHKKMEEMVTIMIMQNGLLNLKHKSIKMCL